MSWVLHESDCLDAMRAMPTASVDCVLTDPPYHRVKSDAWDRQWKTDGDYLDWVGCLCAEWRRVLKPNGSLYCFASTRMAARVECKIGESFEVLNRIVWAKPDPSSSINYGAGNGGRMCKASMRCYYPNTEYVIFAEHFGADSTALRLSGYAAKCDEARGFVFEPLRSYLDGERQSAGLTPDQINIVCGFREKGGMAGRHWFNASQFAMPTERSYLAARDATGRFLRPFEDLRREYEHLRREYEHLRREYEHLRRPFSVSADVPYTDVWDFPTVAHRPGKHPCEKPVALMAHIVGASTRPGAVILDCFAGSGATAVAAMQTGRRCILVEKDPKYCAAIRKRLASPQQRTPAAPAASLFA